MAFLQRKANETTLALDEPITPAEPAYKPTSPTHTTKSAAAPANIDSSFPLLPLDITEDLRKRWDNVQVGFVDEPRDAVKQADELVAHAIKKLSESFTEARANLEGQWTRGGDVNTDDLRVAFKKYRSFFQKLMSV
ncbi:MAG TPA: hypothetical protein VLY24_31450 [Bryobacteraceae bacterium]|nr:hypothetical protein [Bryobacteraceae bacterium]